MDKSRAISILSNALTDCAKFETRYRSDGHSYVVESLRRGRWEITSGVNSIGYCESLIAQRHARGVVVEMRIRQIDNPRPGGKAGQEQS